VALSGTLETFSLPDVLRLLASTKKSGLLALDGDRGRGALWVLDGDLVAGEADRSVVDDVDAVLFELLRFADATFEFDASATAPDADDRRGVDDALESAEARLEEWREIESVVPSLQVRVRMVPEVDDEVQVSRDTWRVLACVGTGASGHDVAHHLGQGEFDVCRALRDLVDAGMVEVTDVEPDEEPAAEAGRTPFTGEEPATNGAPVAVAEAFVAMVHPGAMEADEVELEVEVEAEPTPEPAASFEAAPAFEVEAHPEPVAAFVPEPEPEVEPEPVDDVLPDLAHLSPKAAAAVEATWGEPEAEPVGHEADQADHAWGDEPAAAEAPAEGESDDQNLLLRFLSSAKH
jgi:hypothetical protein